MPTKTFRSSSRSATKTCKSAGKNAGKGARKNAGKDARKSAGKDACKSEVSLMKEQIFFADEQHIKQDLQHFYDQEAKKYHETRKKFWKDAEYLLEAMKGLEGRKVRILEFGCGSGRFATYLSEHYAGKFEYLGVDLSQKLIDFAQKEHPHLRFICADISSFILRQEQESFDIIIGTSSFQHIPSYQERLFLMKYFYGMLSYGGLLMMINRSFSQRFVKKYWKAVFSAVGRWMVSFGRKSWRDILVPRRKKEEVFFRYYHLFGLQELRKLSKFSGFSLVQLGFIDQEGRLGVKGRKARSSLLVAKKAPISFS